MHRVIDDQHCQNNKEEEMKTVIIVMESGTASVLVCDVNVK